MAPRKGAGRARRVSDEAARKDETSLGTTLSSKPQTNPDQAVTGEVLPDNPKQWAELINATWRKGVECIIQTGRLLIKAKDNLGHGKFLPMLQKLDFSATVAERLMAVARNPVLSDSTRGPNLPPHPSTLYVLSRLPPERLEQYIDDGTVNSETERHDAEVLVAKNTSLNSEPVPPRPEPAEISTGDAPRGGPIYGKREPLTAEDIHKMTARSDWARPSAAGEEEIAGDMTPEELARMTGGREAPRAEPKPQPRRDHATFNMVHGQVDWIIKLAADYKPAELLKFFRKLQQQAMDGLALRECMGEASRQEGGE